MRIDEVVLNIQKTPILQNPTREEFAQLCYKRKAKTFELASYGKWSRKQLNRVAAKATVRFIANRDKIWIWGGNELLHAPMEYELLRRKMISDDDTKHIMMGLIDVPFFEVDRARPHKQFFASAEQDALVNSYLDKIRSQ